MAVLCGMNLIQYSARRGLLSVHNLFTSCIRQCLVSCAATEWCQRYLPCYSFSVSSSVCFPCLSARQHSSVLVYPISDSDAAENLGRYLFVRSIQLVELFWIDSNGAMETGRFEEGSVGSEFPTSQDLEILRTLALFGKTIPCGKIFKILFQKFPSRHQSTLLCSNFVKFSRREIGEIVRYLPLTKTTFMQCAAEATKFGKITQNKGHYVVQGHSRSPILVPIESS